MLPPSLKRLLLYVDDCGVVVPANMESWRLLARATPALEELAVDLSCHHDCPHLPQLRALHLAFPPDTPPLPAVDFAGRFPNLESLVLGDDDKCAIEPTLWPQLEPIAACARLTRLCLATTGTPENSTLTPLSRLTALRELELMGVDWVRDHCRPFAELTAAVRAPQLTRLVLRRLFYQDAAEDAAAAAAAGWPTERPAVAAALQAAAAAAGGGLYVEFDDDIDWQPSLLPSAASVEEL